MVIELQSFSVTVQYYREAEMKRTTEHQITEVFYFVALKFARETS
jgi:hypothetical protein